MHDRLNWGVLGASRVARYKVLPGMQRAKHVCLNAIAASDRTAAEQLAADFGFARVLDNYQAVLEDPDVDAVYIPFPNHLHLEWSCRALQAGKHVLCEKPLTVTASETEQLIAVQAETGCYAQEAVMLPHHPRWLAVRDMIARGELGQVKAIHCHISYDLPDPNDIRNRFSHGGGGLLDVGFYAVFLSRFLLNREPRGVSARLDYDPNNGVDYFAAGMLDFGETQTQFTVGTRMVGLQAFRVYGEKKWLDVPLPLNPEADQPAVFYIHDHGTQISDTMTFEWVDQFGLMADAFSRSILTGEEQPLPLTDSLATMRVLDACREASESGCWVALV